MNGELGTLLKKVCADSNRRGLTGVVGIGLEGKTENGQALPRNGAKQAMDNQPGDPMLLSSVECNNALPVISHIRQTEVTAEVNQIEDVLLKTTATKTGA